MSSLKTLFVVAILVGGLYGAYWVLNHTPQATTPPEVADQWPSTLQVSPGTPTTTGAPAGAASRWSSDPSSGGTAPAFAATAPTPSPTAVPSNPASPVAADSAAPVFSPSEVAAGPSPLVTPATGNTTGTNDGAVIAASAASEPTAPPANPWPSESPSPTGPSPMNPPSDFGPPPAAPPSDFGPPSAAGPVAPPADREDFATFARRVEETLAAGQPAQAHQMLSARYTDPSTTPDECRQMQPLLDQLAGTVIFSSQSILEGPYEIMATDTLESIAERYNVPTGLLVKINGLDPRAPLEPGRQIKVVRGPFEAVVDLDQCELTLLLGGELYAGRFRIGVGPESRQEGTLMVTDKRDLSDPAAAATAPADGSLGTRWIGLGQHMGLHGTNLNDPLGRPMNQGCLSLSQRDIEDLYDILSIGSTVIVRR
ncbi:MAG TPA: LysM peptidoglycan-binding domain-containing protein [Thermoguttaceae bacterium]|nr:LysM peptidoglycan-binding domain-containing protein [Thermoguttaceae bacterium]